MVDNLELQRQMQLEAFRSDFSRLAEAQAQLEDKKKDPVFKQILEENLLGEIKHPLVGEIWDDIKRLVLFGDQIQTDEDLKEVTVKAREILEKIKTVKHYLDKTTEEESPGFLHTSAPDEASRREHQAGHTILAWFYNLAGPMVHAESFSGEVGEFKSMIISGVKEKIQ